MSVVQVVMLSHSKSVFPFLFHWIFDSKSFISVLHTNVSAYRYVGVRMHPSVVHQPEKLI